tara:strand:+ start:23523 stop:25430 length:1908 start_codon:yes stop_codon:yes gene_type:complete
MKSKTLLITLFSIFFTGITLAQDTADIEIIKNSGDYYTGESCGENQNQTKEYALSSLISSISVKVSADFQSTNTLQGDDKNVSFDRTVENVVSTYASASLNNLEQINDRRDCGIFVFLYITKDAVEATFRNRAKLVQDIFKKAESYELKYNYASALKYYYFSNILLNSIPSNISSELEVGGLGMNVEIPSRISSILSNARFEVIRDEMLSEKKREITLGVTVDGYDAKSLDFEFWDGNEQIFARSQDGTSIISLIGSSVKLTKINVSVKYKYYENKDEIKEVGELWNLVSAANIKSSQDVRLDAPVIKKVEEYGLADVEENAALNITSSVGEAVSLNDGSSLNEISNAIEAVNIEELMPENIDNLKKYFNQDIKLNSWENDDFLSDKLARVEKFNNIDISSLSSRQNINNTYEGWEFRQLTANTYYPSLSMQSKEYLVPDFDSTGALQDVNFGIMDDIYDGFKRSSTFGKDWDKRQVIIKFVEKYRTAYLSRDLSQLDVMFAEEAVIIVGRVLKVDEKDNTDFVFEQESDKQPSVEYLQFTKKDFLKRQGELFTSKPDIHLGFTTFDIRKKNGKDGVYGVAMRQSYTSTNYSDEGYLFLLIDFNGTQPKIYVRAWQPQEWDEDSLIELANFNVNF